MRRFEDEASVAKKSRVWLLLPGVFVLMAYRASWATNTDLAPMLAIAAAAIYMLVEGSRAPHRPPKKRRHVIADAGGLRVDGTRAIAREQIARVTAVPREDGVVAVHFVGTRPWHTLVVFVDSVEKSTALIEALELDDARHEVTVYRAQPPWARHFRVLAVLLGASPWLFANNIEWLPTWANVVIVLLYALLLLPALMPLRVEVGEDGLAMHWLGKRSLLRFGDIRSVSASKIGVDLVLMNGKTQEIRLTQKDNAADAAIADLVDRLERGITAHESAAAPDEEALLARGSRDVATWLHDMRALGSGASGYRDVLVPRERLWSVLESPSVNPSAREGAALALSASLDEAERARLAMLAQRTVWPRLRVVLEGVSGEHDEGRLRVAVEAEPAERADEDDEPAAPRRFARR